MSDFSLSFKPWEDNFLKGLYLAGVEVVDNTKASNDWVKWTVPSYEYLVVEHKDKNTFKNTIKYMRENNLQLVGSAHDFTSSKDKTNFMYFPIRIL